MNYSGQYAAKGTKGAGYEEHGPYHCEDCIHQKNGLCSHPAIAADPQMASRRTKKGLVKINLEHGCCEYVNQPLDDDDKSALYGD